MNCFALLETWSVYFQLVVNVFSIGNDVGEVDKISDKSGDSADELEHPKYTVRSLLYRNIFLPQPVTSAHKMSLHPRIILKSHTEP